MATLALGGGGSSITGALGNNAVTSALGMTSSVNTPLAFATKFGSGSIFQSSSLAYQIRARNNFDVIFHWFPRRSLVRTYFANAFTAADCDDIRFLVRSVDVPNFTTSAEKLESGSHFAHAVPTSGVNGDGPLRITFLATEFSFLDHPLNYWLNETESPFWIYSEAADKEITVDKHQFRMHSLSQVTPFTRADIEIRYVSSNNKDLHSVICYGAFPVSVETMNVDNAEMFHAGYSVSFQYDSMAVYSPFVAAKGSWGAAATDALGLNSASNSAPWTSTIQDDMLANYLNKSLLKKASSFLNKVTNKAGGKISGGLNNAQKKLGV